MRRSGFLRRIQWRSPIFHLPCTQIPAEGYFFLEISLIHETVNYWDIEGRISLSGFRMKNGN
jgi:hypothetical protein